MAGSVALVVRTIRSDHHSPSKATPPT